jgi:hypothetical protein
MKTICSILIISLTFVSCGNPKAISQNIDSIPIAISKINSDTSNLFEAKYKRQLSIKDSEIIKQKNKEHLLRSEIDMLKKRILRMELDTKIRKVEHDFNQITKE